MRLQSNGNEVYNFTYGVFLSDQDNHGEFRFPGIVPGTQITDRTVKDLGVFTNQRFSITDKDDIQLGVRYSKTTIDPSDQPSRDYDSVTGNASYQHQFTDDLMAMFPTAQPIDRGSANSQNPPVPQIPRSYGNFEEENSSLLKLASSLSGSTGA